MQSFSSKFSTKSTSQRGSNSIASSSKAVGFLGKSKTKKMIVKFSSQTLIIELPVDSLESLYEGLRDELSLRGEFFVQVYYQKKDFKEFIDLTEINQLKAKMPMLKVITLTQKFWSFATTNDWVKKGYQDNQYLSLLVKEGDKVYNIEVMEKFNNLASKMGFDPDRPYKIFSVSNPTILGVFDSYRTLLFGKQRQSPQLFTKDDWKEMSDVEKRKAFLQWLEGYAAKFEGIDEGNKFLPYVIPMLQGTSEEAVWQICQQGFGITAITDDGYYGRGVYFTSNLNYASRYSKQSSKEPGYRVFLLSMVVPGNTFPVTEDPWDAEQKNKTGYHGQPCRVGYQSHFTLVEPKQFGSSSNPTKSLPPFDPAKVCDELVVFEGALALPFFVFYLKE